MNRLAAGVVCLLLVRAMFSWTLTASNSVPSTRLGTTVRSIGANDLKPADCSSVTVTALVTGSGVVAGGSAAELIVGSSAADVITGGAGGDCLMGGGGDDTLDGGSGTDVCVGGPGTDTFNNRCETKVQ